MSSIKDIIHVSPQDLFVSSSTQGTDLGAYAETGDGRGFRYALAGTTQLVVGNLQQASAQSLANMNNLAVSAAAVGATSISTTTTVTLTANQLAGGLLLVANTAGTGFMYKIKSHAAATAATLAFTLEDSVVVALTSSSKIAVIANPYNAVIVNPTATTGPAVGVAIANTATSQYGWLATHGPAAVLAQGQLTAGSSVAASTTTAGAVNAATGTEQIVGYAMQNVATTDIGFVYLTID